MVSLLLSTLMLAFNVQPVEANGTIYIRADGSIDPPTAPIQRNGAVYTFTDNIVCPPCDSIVVQKSNIIIDGNRYTLQSGGFDLWDMNDVTIQNVNIKYCGPAVHLHSSSFITISGNTITDSGEWAVLVEDSSFITISDNNMISNSFECIVIDSSSFNIISGNNIANNGGDGLGISLYESSNNTISGNNIANNSLGIFLWDSDYNIISGNNIANNELYGIWLRKSSNNIIYHNNIVDNSEQVYNQYPINVWDDGYPSGGNYWSDHGSTDEYSGPYQNETGSDGIVDVPYVIDENNQDNYPLISPTIPIPTLVSVHYPNSIEAEEWATITITATNDGGTADWQTIHCGFPDNPPPENIEIVSHDCNGGAEIYPPNSTLWAGYSEYNITSVYVMVEGIHRPWENGKTHTMTVRVKPEKTGTFTFYVKTVSRAEGVTYYDPTDTKDQQDEYVYVYEIEVQGAPVSEWTYMVYLDGDNDVEGEAIRDLNEMEKVGSTPYVNIIALIDRIPGHDSSNGDWTETKSYYVVKDGDTSTINSELLEDLGEMNMGDGDTLSYFINYVKNNYPATHYALILMDHGSGWQGCCQDSTTDKNEVLNMVELKRALADGGCEIDLLAFEACLMGMAEVAYQIKDYVKVMVGSEDFIRKFPIGLHLFPHDSILSDLVSNPSMDASQLATTMIEKFKAIYRYDVTFKSTISAIDLSKIEDLIASLNDFSNSMVGGLDDYATKITDIRNTIANSNEEYGKREPIKGIKEDFDYTDLYYFAHLVMQQIGDENIRDSAAKVIANIESVIIGEWHQSLHTNSHGLSIYFPETKGVFQRVSYSRLDSVSSLETTWKDFLEKYLNKVSCEIFVGTKTVEGFPFDDIPFRVDFSSYRTQKIIGVFKGTHLFDISPLIYTDSKIMVFDHWEDENSVLISENPTFPYDTQADKQFWAVYKALLSAKMIELSESQGKLYLHAYDTSGKHIGLNYELNVTEIGVQGAFYFDFQNGTTVIIVPGHINELKLVVDGKYAEEETETYNITISIIRDAQASNQSRLSGSVKKGEQQEFLVKILSDGTIEITQYFKGWMEQYWIVLAVVLVFFVCGSFLLFVKYKKKQKIPLSKT